MSNECHWSHVSEHEGVRRNITKRVFRTHSHAKKELRLEVSPHLRLHIEY